MSELSALAERQHAELQQLLRLPAAKVLPLAVRIWLDQQSNLTLAIVRKIDA